MKKEEVIEGEVITTEIVKADEQQIQLFRAKEPKEIIKEAQTIAKAVADIVEQQKLFTNISGKKYVHCEGWTSMGALLGIFPQIIGTREEHTAKGFKCIATCEVRTLSGNLLSRAESECASWESNKQTKPWDDYAIRSMAQTRATSKAMRIPLSWIMVLAGYQPTPSEEMNADMVKDSAQSKPPLKKQGEVASDRQALETVVGSTPASPSSSTNEELADIIYEKFKDAGITKAMVTKLVKPWLERLQEKEIAGKKRTFLGKKFNNLSFEAGENRDLKFLYKNIEKVIADFKREVMPHEK